MKGFFYDIKNPPKTLPSASSASSAVQNSSLYEVDDKEVK
jgi:hypothetical protein